MTDATIVSVDPSHQRASSPGRLGVIADAEDAIRAAHAAWPRGRHTPNTRAQVLFDAAQWMRQRRFDLAALEIFEAGKPWFEADGDICEAIDYCEYYGRQILRLAAWRRGRVTRPVRTMPSTTPPRGVGVVIPPWNFPLAIPTGMTVAALVCGNAVVLKPAEQTPATAAILAAALRAGGLPDGVLNFLPGIGETVGAYLIAHPDIAFVAFTGSKAVGLSIIEQAAIHRPGQRQVKRVIAEMGGKNPLIVDTDADLDQAVPITIQSAFSYSGQKCSACSRVIVIGDRADEFVVRLAGAAERLRIGAPEEMGTEVGPLIDEDAFKRVASWQERAADFGEVVMSRHDVPLTVTSSGRRSSTASRSARRCGPTRSSALYSRSVGRAISTRHSHSLTTPSTRSPPVSSRAHQGTCARRRSDCTLATCTSTARSPVPSSAATPSVATGCPASARRREALITFWSS